MPIVFANGQATLESQADQVGHEYMAKAGYDPEALADFFERILSSGPKRASAFSPWVKFPHPPERRPTRYATSATTSSLPLPNFTTNSGASLIAKLTPPGAAPTLNPLSVAGVTPANRRESRRQTVITLLLTLHIRD